jgi:hypothetical protein
MLPSEFLALWLTWRIMKYKKSSTLRSRENLLKTLAASSLGSATADELLVAFKEDGTDTLRDLVVKWLHSLEDEKKHNYLAPSRINIKLIETQTSKERIAKTVHRVPKVSFILNGVEYDPKDIRRFNGTELHFVVGSKAVSRDSLLAFEDKALLTNWLHGLSLRSSFGNDKGSGIQLHARLQLLRRLPAASYQRGLSSRGDHV